MVKVPELLVAVVDDDAPIRVALGRLLRSAGFESLAFACGSDFLKSMPIPGLSCVVLDVQMPGMSGLEVEAQLTKLRHYVPVIFITGHEDSETQRRALGTRPLAFLHKPVASSYLIGAIETLR